LDYSLCLKNHYPGCLFGMSSCVKKSFQVSSLLISSG
jgi:hypothetical protein